MVIQNYKDIRSRAKKTLDYTPWDVKKLVLVFALVSWGVSFLLLGIDALLALGTEKAQGLSGLGVLSLLETASSALSLVFEIFNLFWLPGILYCGLMLLREQDPWPKGLLRGFKKWKSFVKLTILVYILIFALTMVLAPVISILSLPFMGGFEEILANMPENEADMVAYMEALPADQLIRATMPMLIMAVVAVLAITIPLFYRARLVFLLLLDEEQLGVREAIRFSFKLTKGSCIQLFRLDLSFWWYYLLLALVNILPLGAELIGWSGTAATLGCSAVAAILGIGVYMLGLMKVNTANAVAYDHLRTMVLTDAPQLPEGLNDAY